MQKIPSIRKWVKNKIKISDNINRRGSKRDRKEKQREKVDLNCPRSNYWKWGVRKGDFKM